MDSIWIEIVLVALGILANGFFAGSEIALISARISRLAELRQHGVKGAATAMQLKETPDAFLATIQIAITAVGTLASAVGGATAVEALTPSLATLGFGQWAQPVALALVIIVITYFSLVVGELAPKAIALRNPERAATLVAGPILALSRVSSRLVGVLTASTSALLRLVGLRAAAETSTVSESELRYLLREGAKHGVFEKVEEELVHNVFEFGDTIVREIMVPRHQIKALDVATPPADLLVRAAELRHSRLPVYEGSLEHVVGTITLKDILQRLASGHLPGVRDMLRPPLFIPETARISALLREFQRTRQHLAIVVDEYGSLAGLATVESVVEEIVGDIHEEGPGAEPQVITRQPDGSFIADGMARLDDVAPMLGIDLPPSTEYTTVAGLIIAAANAIPAPGSTVTAHGYRWTVLEMDGPRIAKVKLAPG